MSTYKANPVNVEAHQIMIVGGFNDDGSLPLTLYNNQIVVATREMLARYIPAAGDYWVKQEDGYTYINPRDVFERKYSLI